MRWTARQPTKERILVALFWPTLVGLLAVQPASAWSEGSLASRAFGLVLLVAALAALVGLTLWLFVPLAEIADGTLTLRALRRSERLRVPFAAVVGYHMDKAGRWWVHTRPPGTGCTDPAERTRVAVREPWELHRAVVELAPKRLGGRRWRFPGTPPAEEFRNLWTFDMEGYAGRCLPQLAGVLTGVAIGYALTHRRNLGMLGQPLSLLLILLVELWGRLDATDEGLAYRAPFSNRRLPWTEVKAVFREGTPGRRSFLLVGARCAVHIPAHLASDFGLMEKVFYSLPDPVLCVNFDETTFRGFKVREKERTKAPSRLADLLPAPPGAG